jgi:hypothetical protein
VSVKLGILVKSGLANWLIRWLVDFGKKVPPFCLTLPNFELSALSLELVAL